MTRPRISISPDEATYAEIQKLAKTANVTMADLTLRLVRRALRMDGEPELNLQPVRQVRIDPEPLFEPLREVNENVLEVLRRVHQYGLFVHRKAPAANQAEAEGLCRDEAERLVDRWLGRNRGA